MKLGTSTIYPSRYAPELLEFLPRDRDRTLGKLGDLVVGTDVWNGYEFSWFDSRGSPEQGVLQITVDARSPSIVESKSLKLYLGGFSFERYETREEILNIIQNDLSGGLKTQVEVLFFSPSDKRLAPNPKIGYSVDTHTLQEPSFTYNPALLRAGNEDRSEVLFTDSFRSLCPVTGQPDWASIYVLYDGREIIPESFFAYITSLRNHQGFHEQCVELVFRDIFTECSPKELSVMGCFCRRGGIDINPIRTLKDSPPLRYQRTFRQ